MCRFGLKTGIDSIDFAYLGLNSGKVFEGIHEFVVVNEKERDHANSKWIVRNLLCCILV